MKSLILSMKMPPPPQLSHLVTYRYCFDDWDEQWRRKDAYWGCPQFLLISEVPVTANGRIHN